MEYRRNIAGLSSAYAGLITTLKESSDMSRMHQRLLVVGLVLAVLAGTQLIWLAFKGREIAMAFGGFTGALLVIVGALVWAAIAKNKS